MIPATFVDGIEAVRAWINDFSGVAGEGRLLPLGAHSWLTRSPGQGAYALLVYAGGGVMDGDATFTAQPRISANVYAGTELAARTAAVALREAMEQFQYQPPVIVTLDPQRGGGRALVQTVDNITGPTPLPDDGYLIDAVWTLSPSP